MREIKFRFWAVSDDYPDGCMYYPEKNPNFLINFSGDVIHDYHHGGVEHSLVWARIGYSNRELMQYTGLNDKNGKEIYEGDIVLVPYSVERGDGYNDDDLMVVEYDKGHFYGVGQNDEYLEFIDGEVIGNIYENPELLESE